MDIRRPVRAGTFYESSAAPCRHHARKLLDAAKLPERLPTTIYGGLVPHAGWQFSGAVAAMTLRALAAAGPIQTVVLFGADHVGTVRQGEAYTQGVWQTPLGEVHIAEDVAQAILAACDAIRANPDAHASEHSLEVQIPLIQELAPEAKIVPLAVPPRPLAVEIGRAVGQTLAEKFPAARIVGSTDLTHHGGHFPAPGGHGAVGEHWTRQNDRRMLDLVEAMDADAVVGEAERRGNACGAGAIAATIAACAAMGATRGTTLQYTNSYEVIHKLYPDDPDDTTVGYASVIFA